jgi:hypothetical protein
MLDHPSAVGADPGAEDPAASADGGGVRPAFAQAGADGDFDMVRALLDAGGSAQPFVI